MLSFRRDPHPPSGPQPPRHLPSPSRRFPSDRLPASPPRLLLRRPCLRRASGRPRPSRGRPLRRGPGRPGHRRRFSGPSQPRSPRARPGLCRAGRDLQPSDRSLQRRASRDSRDRVAAQPGPELPSGRFSLPAWAGPGPAPRRAWPRHPRLGPTSWYREGRSFPIAPRRPRYLASPRPPPAGLRATGGGHPALR